MNHCPACGRKAEGGVCAGPHPDYRLRDGTGRAGRYVELPDWWPVRERTVIPAESDDPDVHLGVTASGTPWCIRYDPTERLRRQAEAERIEQEVTRRMRERADALAELHRLADEFGMTLRPKSGVIGVGR